MGGNPTRNQRTDELGNLPRGLSAGTCPFLNPLVMSPETVSFVGLFRSVMKLHFLFAASSFVSGSGLFPSPSGPVVCLASLLP